MKKILTGLLLLLFTVIILDRAFVYIFSRLVFSKTISGEAGGTVNYLIQKKSNVDFFILGSSRAKFQIDPALLTNIYNGNGYNAGISGTGGLLYNELLLKLLSSKKIIPKMIVLQVDPYPYFAKDENLTAETLQLYPFLDQSEALRQSVNENGGFIEKFKLFFHAYRYNGKFLNIIFNYQHRNSITLNNGFEGLPGKLDTTNLTPPEMPAKSQPLSERKINALLGIIKTCKSNKIKLNVVFPPSYRNAGFSEFHTKRLISLLYENGVKNVYDFSDIATIPSLLPACLWKDITHVNRQGAVLFSEILNKAMRETNL